MTESTIEAAPTSLREIARLAIIRDRVEDLVDLKRVMLTAARVSAQTLDVTRVGVWSLSDDGQTLRRVTVHDARAPGENGDFTLPLAAWPAYRASVMSRRVVAASDARTDPRTLELLDTYLLPHRVTSMMDAPLFVDGEIWGIVCHEHTGEPRTWTTREIDFAASVADMLSATLGQSARIGLEERLRRSEAEVARLRQAEAVVRTASAIGHDIDAVLRSITETAENALGGLQGAPESPLATILEECRRGSRIVGQLRELDQPVRASGTGVDLSFVVGDTRTTIEGLLGPNHALEIDLAETANVAASRTDVERVLLNLVLNAKEAMPDGGSVTVRVRRAGRDVALEIHDTGTGIAPEDAPRVFDPYFTTKSGRSAGLGLFAVETIAKSTGGEVAIVSLPGGGTTVTVTWPLV